MKLIRTCDLCGETFEISESFARRLLDKGGVLPKHCSACISKKSVQRSLVCRQCGETFMFSQFREEKMKKKYGASYKEPQYCDICREQWRINNLTGPEETSGVRASVEPC